MIIGWGHQKNKNIYNLFRNPCINCNQVVDWELYEIAYYYTFFFIPVFSYKSEYKAICPICGQNYYKDSIQFMWLSRRAEIYESYEKNEITLEDYQKKLKDLKLLEEKEAKEHGVPTEEEIKEIIKSKE